jgi:hypothetical protein
MTTTTRLPVPDPTRLTTDALLREVAHVRDLYDLRFDQLDLRLQQRFEAQSKVLDAALTSADVKTAALADKIEILTKYAAATSAKSAGGAATWGYVVGAVFLVIAVITFATR